MKQFEVYRNIRKGAMIWGLPITMFALIMICIVGSLMVIIFSFSLTMIIGVFICNTGLYIILIRISSNPRLFQFSSVFPGIISNKKSSLLNYEEN
ncbi:hypothetical protein [Christiangramia sp.]|uniref:hypothetical protein n=1 Tax=Christiangramia sp. TaxID=1931228 RepID=UPI0026210017|nr:hypothetical protein [Christiangramia sp.]